MAPDNMGYVTVKYEISEEGVVTIFEYDYNKTRRAKAVFNSDLKGLSLSESLQGDPDGVFREATVTVAHKGARIPDKPPRPTAVFLPVADCGEDA